MFTTLIPNCSSIDMSVKKKLYTVLILTFVCILYYCSFGNRDEHFVSMKQSMDEYELLLRETREQILDRLKMCQRDCQHWDPDVPVIYVITPTYTRPVQKAELTRLSQTLMHVNNLHWLVIEDAPKKTILVENLLARTTLNYTHLIAQTPQKYRRKGASRGVPQRNEALKWLRKNRSEKDKGVIYFADDDNSYSIQIFEEMRSTREVSVWPVGLVGGLMVEKPLLNLTTGKVIGWNSVWRPDRHFPIDMAGFAINLGLMLRRSTAYFSFNVTGGFLESHMLDQVTTQDRLEPKADNCTQMGTALGKEEAEDKPTVWLSPSVLARIKGEDNPYQDLIRGMEKEYTEMKGISINDFNDISRSVEDALNPIKPVKTTSPSFAYGRYRRSFGN